MLPKVSGADLPRPLRPWLSAADSPGPRWARPPHSPDAGPANPPRGCRSGRGRRCRGRGGRCPTGGGRAGGRVEVRGKGDDAPSKGMAVPGDRGCVGAPGGQQREVAARVIGRVGHHDEVDARGGGVRAHRGDRRRQRGVVVRGPDVAGDDQHRACGQQGEGRGDAAGGFQRLGFARPVQAHPECGAVAQRRDQPVGEVRGVDRDVAVAGARERLDLVDDQRLAARRQQRLRAGVGERAHPLAATGGEDHRGGAAGHQNVYPAAGAGRASTASTSASSGPSSR